MRSVGRQATFSFRCAHIGPRTAGPHATLEPTYVRRCDFPSYAASVRTDDFHSDFKHVRTRWGAIATWLARRSITTAGCLHTRVVAFLWLSGCIASFSMMLYSENENALAKRRRKCRLLQVVAGSVSMHGKVQ